MKQWPVFGWFRALRLGRYLHRVSLKLKDHRFLLILGQNVDQKKLDKADAKIRQKQEKKSMKEKDVQKE